MTIELTQADDGRTLSIDDPVERRRVTLRFPDPVSPAAASADAFVYPVDEAVSVTTRSLTVQNGASALVLDASGETRATVNTESWTGTVEPGEYYLDVSSQVKTYLWVETPAPIEIEPDADASTIEIDFGEAVEVRIGARSTHEHPEGTITTSPAPEDVMTAVSYLGSALKDDGPMRSFPTLRGHPPTIELGDQLAVPEELDRPETGVTIAVPRSYEYIFPVVPLAYYLGAEVVPGDEPRLRADGVERSLEGPGGFEATVERVLKQVFTCDCYVRAGGPYSYELSAREAFVSETGLDPDALYGRSLPDQLEAYLDVPYEVVEPYVPEWGVAAHLEHLPTSVEYLPFLANDLAIVRSPAAVGTAAPMEDVGGPADVPAEGAFTRSVTTAPQPTTIGGPEGPVRPDGPTRPTVPQSGSSAETEMAPLSWPGGPQPMVSPASYDAQEQLWIADGVPLGADRPTVESYRNALDRDPVDGAIEIAVVCNDDRMAAEDEAVRELLSATTPFDVEIRPYRNLMTDELRELLERGADFLHYIGHIDARGFACPDGYLDASRLDAVNVDAFFLNACRSYDQGRALIDAGAIAGVVTLEEVLNSDAVRTGREMARLLNSGFPLTTALGIASDEHDIDDQYTVVGDGGMQIAQTESIAYLIEADATDADTFEYRHRTFVTPQFELGSVYTPTISGVDGWYLAGDTARGEVSRADLRDALSYEDEPARIDGAFGWSVDVAERLDALAGYRADVRELADLAIELTERELERGGPAEDGHEELAARFHELRRDVESRAVDFDAADFRAAFRSVLSDDG